MNVLKIGTRESRLAVAQAELLAAFCRERGIPCELVTMTTTGDRILDRRLDEVGGKGLFVKELDQALRSGRTDVSVHSAKDLPVVLPEDLPILGFSRREDPRDALVLPADCKVWDRRRPVGCSSRRRMLQLQLLYPDVRFETIRGNVLTRLARLDSGRYGALVLAAAGLRRLGLENRINRYFSPEEMIPAACQGVLCVQGRAGEEYGFLQDFFDPAATEAVLAERAFLRASGGDCTSPAAAYAVPEGGGLTLRGLVYNEEKKTHRAGVLSASGDDPEALGTALARRLLEETESGSGKVYLIGAGPGDAGLLTCKGKWALEQADVAVCDALVGAAVLALIPPGVRRIYVGKRAGNHAATQDEINHILLREAQAGHTVARLQGGDPFLFGRGGEELALLAAHGVDAEVVPGVSSAMAVPAYHGIPVTHRDLSSSLHIFTAHRKAGTALNLDYPTLAKLGGTLVFLMGVTALDELCRGLLDAGMDPDTPAALLSQGTTAAQRRAVSTLSSLPKAAAGLSAPAVIVVGAVCSLSEPLAWAERRPLHGLRFLVTRPRRRGSALTERLRALGGEVVELPAIETRLLPEAGLDELWDSRWLVLTSPSGVELFFDLLRRRGLDVRRLAHLKIAALGKGTAARLADFGLLADLTPETYDAASLGEALAARVQPGERVFLARAREGSAALPEKLAHADLVDRAIYETVPLRTDLDPAALLDGRTYPLFTSASTVRSFAAMTGAERLSGIPALCIGPQTAAQARAYGMEVKIAAAATVDALVELACGLAASQK